MRKAKGLIILACVLIMLCSLFVGCSIKRTDDINKLKNSDKEVTITFISNGGSEIDSVITPSNLSIKKPDDPIKEDYVFAGWYLEHTFQTKFNFDLKIKEDLTLYAKWIPAEITITFHTNGGDEMEPMKLNRNYMISYPNMPYRRGYEFVSWCLDANLTTEFDFSYVPETDIDLYVKWEKNIDGKHSITLIGNGGRGTILSSFVEGQETQLPNDWIKQDEEFAGWYEKADFSGEKLTEIPANRDRKIVLYAKWIPIQYHFKLISDNEVIQTFILNKGERKELPILEDVTGYKFLGWSNLPDVSRKIVTEAVAEGETEQSFYALWKAINCNLHFFTYNNEESYVTQRSYGTVVKLQVPIDECYNFEGWYKTQELLEKDKYTSTLKIEQEELYFYGKWTPKEYHIKLRIIQSNGVEEEPVFLNHTYGETLALPDNLDIAGHTLIGWAKAQGNEYVICHEIGAKEAGNMELFALWANQEYSVSLDPNGGVMTPETCDTSYKYGSLINLPTCAKEGYRFLGWEDKTTGKVIDRIKNNDFGNKNLIAKYEPKTYTVIMYESDYQVRMQQTAYQDKVVIADPVKEGYDFVGWYLDREKTIKMPDNQIMPAKGLILYAKFNPQTVTITFNPENKKDKAVTLTGEVGSEILKENIPSFRYTGREFKGWFEYAEPPLEGDNEYILKKMPTKSLDLYARWEGLILSFPSHSITYYDIDNTVMPNLEPKQYEESIGAYLPKITKEGYFFEGWTEDPKRQSKGIYTIKSNERENKNLYSIWSPKKITIKYYVDENDYIARSHEYGTDGTLDTDFTKTGHDFKGWYDNPNFTGEPITSIPNDTLENKTFYAKWEPTKYVVTLDGNGGTGSPSQIPYTFGDVVVLPTDWTRTGYVFVSWTYINYPGIVITQINSTDYGSKKLIANWQPILYDVVLEGRGGSGTESEAHIYGQETPLPKDWVREGYDFMGWYMDPEMLDGPYEHVDADEIGTTTFFANWRPHKYKITLIGTEDGTGTIIDGYYYGMITDLPIDWTREGYDFAGWYLDSNRDISTKIESIDSSSATDLNLYAKWLPKQYTITYVTGTGVNNQETYYCGEKIQEPSIPVQEGKVFSGWYTEDTFKNLYVFDKMPPKSITIYAKWEEVALLTYSVGSEIVDPIKIAPGSSYTLISDVEKESWNQPLSYFDGWYYDEAFTQKCPDTIVINGHITVYAKWIRRGFLGYYDEFIPVLRDESHIVEIDSERELIAIMDFIMFYYIETPVNMKLNYLTDYSEEAVRALIVDDIFQKKLTAGGNAITYGYNKNTHIARVGVSLKDFGKNISIATRNPEKKIVPKTINGLIPIYNSSRGQMYDNFALNKAEKELSVETSDQLFYAAQYGCKPICISNSPADRMLRKAKDVLRTICDDNMNDFEKVYAIYCWFVQNIDYDHVAVDDAATVGGYLYKNHNHGEAWHMEGVFDRRLAVCDGMSKAFTLMCALEGISSIRVTSNSHAWNKVYIDLDGNKVREWYGVDVTWGSSEVNNPSYCVTNNVHFLFTDSYKSNNGAIQQNQLDIVAKDKVDAYKYATYEDKNKEIKDCVIENDLELENIIEEASSNTKALTSGTITINIKITYLKESEYNKKIDNICASLGNNIDMVYKGYIPMGGSVTLVFNAR